MAESRKDLTAWIAIGLTVAAGVVGGLMAYSKGLTQAAVTEQRVVALEDTVDKLQATDLAALASDSHLSERVGILEATCRRK